MKLFLFLDDWMLDGYRDVVRVFPQPVRIDDGPQTEINNHAAFWRDPESGLIRCWYFRYDVRRSPDGRPYPSTLNLATSDDGIHFRPLKHGGPSDPRTPDRPQSLLIPNVDAHGEPFDVCFDPDDPNPGRRYKSVSIPGWIYTSPDGIHWADSGERAFDLPAGSDAGNTMFWNPVLQCWGVICRTGNPDRRIALTKSIDFRHWTRPRVVIHPDAMDEPFLQFYGMPPFWYEDLFIGLLWAYRVPLDEARARHKMYGRIFGQLAYSYDGELWLRPHRQAFLPIRDPGEFGFGNVLPAAIVPDGDRILVYATGYSVHHATEAEIHAAVAGQPGFGALHVFQMRRDGFAYLEDTGGCGWVRTRGLISRDGSLTVNYACAPGGEVRVQVADERGVALPGYAFEDCAPLTGSSCYGAPRWRERALESIVGQWCRLEFRLFDARLYAYRWNADVAYAKAATERI